MSETTDRAASRSVLMLVMDFFFVVVVVFSFGSLSQFHSRASRPSLVHFPTGAWRVSFIAP